MHCSLNVKNTEKTLLALHFNSRYAEVPQRYVMRTLPNLLLLQVYFFSSTRVI